MPNVKSQIKTHSSPDETLDPLPIIRIRKLTVSSQEQVRHADLYCKDYVTLPFLRLCGKWLEEVGFGISSKVKITVRDRMLVIEPAQE